MRMQWPTTPSTEKWPNQGLNPGPSGHIPVLKYRKVTRLGIEPRTFWTYTRCSNQLSYPALEFNQLILYLCNLSTQRHIQCHSLHARSTLWPWHDQISQSGNYVTDYIIQFQHTQDKNSIFTKSHTVGADSMYYNKIQRYIQEPRHTSKKNEARQVMTLANWYNMVHELLGDSMVTIDEDICYLLASQESGPLTVWFGAPFSIVNIINNV